MPCAQEVNIPLILELVNYYKVYDIPEAAFNGYLELTQSREWIEGKNAVHCIECGECEPKCPKKLKLLKT